MDGFNNMEKYWINKNWKNIAKGHTAFCILGGPSSQELDNINDIIKNNFTVTINRSIEIYPEVDMYITADNGIAREYFEENDFFLHKFIGGKLLKNQAAFNFEEEPIWMKGKREIILKNPNLIKIIACSNFPCYNTLFTTGQLYKYKGIEYCKQVSNTYLCTEFKTDQGEHYPTLSPTIPYSLENYGVDPYNLLPGGNIAVIIFQLLWYMGFEKIITIGYGDKGRSVRAEGYDNKFKEDSFTEFKWSEVEIHALMTHYQKWGDRMKILKGGELCKEYAPFSEATQKDLHTNPDEKNKLIEKILKL